MHHHDVKDNAAAAGTEEKVKHIWWSRRCRVTDTIHETECHRLNDR
jgi:hypothetical protein